MSRHLVFGPVLAFVLLASTLVSPALAAPASGAGQNEPSPYHNIWIADLDVPHVSAAGHTRYITVDIGNRSWPEAATVYLYKSVGGAPYVLVASQTDRVPYSITGNMATFRFQYTFTTYDASADYVRFGVYADLHGFVDVAEINNWDSAVTYMK